MNARDKWDNDGSISHRTLLDFDLTEVSILTKTPAYIGTSVEMRGDASDIEIREFRSSGDVDINIEINISDNAQDPPVKSTETTEKSAPNVRRDFYSNNLKLLKLKGE